MSKGPTWTAQEKTNIVLQGLKGRTVAELCHEYQIHQAQYYRWRDQFLAHAPQACSTQEQSRREQRLLTQNQR